MNNDTHLSPNDIVELLANEPNDENLRSVQAHLDRCADCQSQLEQAAAGGWWWQRGQQLFAASMQRKRQSNFSENGERIDHPPSWASDFVDQHRDEVEAIVKSFKPTVHPELLGQVDEYVIEKLIGVGGMGVVFKAVDQELNRPVAIKFLSPRWVHLGIARQRFAREATATAAICHDNVIPIHRINVGWSYPFFVMPYIFGDTLEQHVEKEGALAPNRVVEIAGQIASGLAAAHEKGLIHRDIKPANILLQNGCNRVVITDFGLARQEGDTHLTQTGMIAGTPDYMSPEQVEGNRLDPRTDLFSLGAVMYWMATGTRPFRGQSHFDSLNRIRQHTPTRIRRLNSEIPTGLERTIERLLEKKSAARFPGAKELEQYLSHYAAHLKNPVDVQEPQVSNRRMDRVKRVGLALAIGVLLLSGGLRWMSLSPGLPSEKEAHGENQQRSNLGASSLKSANSDWPLERQDELERAISLERINQLRELAGQTPEQIELRAGDRQLQILDKNETPILTLEDRVATANSRTSRQLRQEMVVLSELKTLMAQRILERWKHELQHRFGARDLFVAEPVLLEIECQLASQNWSGATSRLRSLSSLLKNNFVNNKELLEDINQLMEYCAAAKENGGTTELRKVACLEHLDRIYEGLDQAMRCRIAKIHQKD